MRQVELGRIEYYTRHEMLEVVIIDGVARGIITRDLVTGEICRHEADAEFRKVDMGMYFICLPMLKIQM